MSTSDCVSVCVCMCVRRGCVLLRRALICYCNMPRTAENERLRCSGRVSISQKDLLKEQTRQLEARSSQRPAGTAGHAAKCEGYQMPLLLSCVERAHEMLTATNY